MAVVLFFKPHFGEGGDGWARGAAPMTPWGRRSVTFSPKPFRPIEKFLFGEFLSKRTTDHFAKLWEMDFQMLIAIGTSAQFPYISEPFSSANAIGIPTVEINPDDTYISRFAKYKVRCGASEAAKLIAHHL